VTAHTSMSDDAIVATVDAMQASKGHRYPIALNYHDYEVAPAFAEAFVGVFSQELSYTAFRLAETGWEAALRQLGAIELLDTAKYNRHLFDREVGAITNSRDTGGGIVVCRRQQD
jgi:hypothetical protein